MIVGFNFPVARDGYKQYDSSFIFTGFWVVATLWQVWRNTARNNKVLWSDPAIRASES
jgi:hypothetical protein